MSTPDNHHDITSATHFQELLSADLERVSLIYFWAPWAAPCKQMNELVIMLAKQHPTLLTLRVEAEEQSDIADSFDVESVPLFVVLRGHTLLGRVVGADAAGITTLITTHLSPRTSAPLSTTDEKPAPPPETETPAQLEDRLQKIMRQHKIMLFMKGVPDAPRCGFSRKAVALLRDQKVEFGSFDILEDETVRSGLKIVNNWPTFPQFIVNGEFIGGLDVVVDMVENGEFAEVVAQGA